MDMVPVYLGLDYHDETIRVCAMAADGDVLINRNLHNDVDELRQLVLDREWSVQGVAIEACCGAADFATQLAERTGWTVRLAHPGAVQRLKQGPDKTDAGDAWHLANLVRVGYLPEVWLADETTRQLRRLVRYRQGLAEQRKDVKLRIGALLREERVVHDSGANAWTKAWIAWVQTVSLGEQTRWVLDQELRRLHALNDDVAQVEQRMRDATQHDPVVRQLLDQSGVGLVTALALRAVVGRFDRFRSGKQLSRYCGVTPCNASSGKRQADAGLVASGHDILRPMLIQLAKRLPRHEPRWRELHRKLRVKKPANVVSAAIANRWLRRLYHDLRTPRQDVVLKRQAG